MVAREQLERQQRGAAHRGAVVVEAAPQQLRLRTEPKLTDCAERDRALAEVCCAGRSLEFVVPLRAQLRELALLPLTGQRLGLGRRLRQAHSSSIVRAPGPM